MCTRKLLALSGVTFCILSLICVGVSYTPNKNFIQYLESNLTITSKVSKYSHYALYSICISLVSSIVIFILSVPCNFYCMILLSSCIFALATIVVTVVTIVLYFVFDSSATLYNFVSLIIFFITTLLLLCYTASAKGVKDNAVSEEGRFSLFKKKNKSNEPAKKKKVQQQAQAQAQQDEKQREKHLTSQGIYRDESRSTVKKTVIPAVTHTLINGSVTNQPLSPMHYDDQFEQSRSASRRPSTPRPQLPGSLVNSRPATPVPSPIAEVVHDEPVTSSSLTCYNDSRHQSPPLTPPPLDASLQDPFRQRINNP